jgi:cytochrome b6-f complex iron-sulfur subunit
MAEKKKMSVAEMLAAARKADTKKSGDEPAADPPASETVAEAPPAESPGEAAAPAAPKPAAKPAAKAAAGGPRPSVAEMMAMARAGGSPKAEAPVAKKEAAPKVAPKPAEKPKAAEKPKPAEKAAPVVAEKDTASILSPARKEAKPGPLSKAEAAAKAKTEPVEKPTKEAKAKLVVPPMPAKPEYAKPKPKAAAEAQPEERRWFLTLGFSTMAATFGLWTLGFARFMFPNILTEPPSRFKVGFPSDFPPGSVEEKFKALFGVWVVNTEYQGKREIVALRTVCTHLGCTPNWLEGEQKFKCPCHGSGFYKDGINFEGPAPRPLERYAIQLADDGQLEVDKSKLFQEELGQWNDPASFVAV